MKHYLRYLIVTFSLWLPVNAYSIYDPAIEQINESLRNRTKQAVARERAREQSLDRERENYEKAKAEYAAEKEFATITIQNLPDTPDRQRKLDEFTCKYPPAKLLPSSNEEVRGCMINLEHEREKANRDAIAQQERESRAQKEREEAAKNALLEAERRRTEQEAIAKLQREEEEKERLTIEKAKKKKYYNLAPSLVLVIVSLLALFYYITDKDATISLHQTSEIKRNYKIKIGISVFLLMLGIGVIIYVHHKMKSDYDLFRDVDGKYYDALRLAGSTGRIALSAPIQNLQSIKHNLKTIVVSDCYKPAQDKMMLAMSLYEDSFIEFMKSNERLANEKTAHATRVINEYKVLRDACYWN